MIAARAWGIGLLASLALVAGCRPEPQPAPPASYRADVQFTPPGRAPEAFTLYADGSLRRFERRAGSGALFAIVTDGRTGAGFVSTEMDGQPLAMTFSRPPASALDLAETFEAQPQGSSARRCRHLRETGREVAQEGRVACVTSDGVLLYVESNGAREWALTSLTRGPVDPALFQIPAGAETLSAEAFANTPAP